jgi:hypothetical protein
MGRLPHLARWSDTPLVAKSRAVVAQDTGLRRGAIEASARATEWAERSLRRVRNESTTAAQYVALATRRLDSVMPEPEADRAETGSEVRAAQCGEPDGREGAQAKRRRSNVMAGWRTLVVSSVPIAVSKASRVGFFVALQPNDANIR